MTKIVYNSCFGGFGLSEAAMIRYGELKGYKVYPEVDRKYSMVTHYWIVPPEERRAPLDWSNATADERAEYNAWRESVQLPYERDMSRTDPVLVQVVEELGSKAASGMCARLSIAELPPGTLYRIDEYDGNESVVTQDGYDWSVA